MCMYTAVYINNAFLRTIKLTYLPKQHKNINCIYIGTCIQSRFLGFSFSTFYFINVMSHFRCFFLFYFFRRSLYLALHNLGRWSFLAQCCHELITGSVPLEEPGVTYLAQGHKWWRLKAHSLGLKIGIAELSLRPVTLCAALICIRKKHNFYITVALTKIH